jgi:hypothetical protein
MAGAGMPRRVVDCHARVGIPHTATEARGSDGGWSAGFLAFRPRLDRSVLAPGGGIEVGEPA